MRFVDTNILIYAVSREPEDADKRLIAREALTSPDLTISAQVLQEFYVQATRPTGPCKMSGGEALDFMNDLRRYPIQALTAEVVWTAITLHQRFGVSYWDGAILAAARHSGCDSVLSEDMSHGQDYGGVRVINPFAAIAEGR